MSALITEEELEEDISYFADVFVYTSDAIDDEKPAMEEQAEGLSEKYEAISSEDAKTDMDRMRETIRQGRFPEDYAEEFATNAAFRYLKHSNRSVNIDDMKKSIEGILEE